MLLNNLRFISFTLISILIVGCGGSQQAPAQQTPSANAKRVDESKAGNVTGHITYDGPASANSQIKLDSDPACVRQHPQGLTLDTIVVKNGGLENVFVYVKSGLGDYAFDTPTKPVTLDQNGC